MKKQEAFEICKFVSGHYDYVSQKDWFEFTDRLLAIVLEDSWHSGHITDLVEEFPQFFVASKEL